ncbi:MAG TPA: arginase, partial [Clostridium sp.]|nr:arginase [Clostridium sp.]
DRSLSNLYFDGIKVKKENVFIIGARDLDEGELQLIKDIDLTVWNMEKVREIGVEQVCQ